MKKTVQKIPFLRLSVALAVGAVLGATIEIPVLISVAGAVLMLFLAYISNRFYRFGRTSFFGLTVNLLLIFTGITVYNLYNQRPIIHDAGVFTATLLEAPVEKSNSYESVIEIESVYRNDSVFAAKERVLTYFEKNSSAENLKPGDVIVFNRHPQLVENNGNPFEFDYKSYLARKKIYRQVYLPGQDWLVTSAQHSFSLKILAEKTRLKLLNIYRDQNLGENELNILSALTLGYKRELDPETKRVFSSAGAMHILAVSGLHVGIIYLILEFLLGFLKRQRTGKIIFLLAVLVTLWFFAFLTGLSPSVSRAATMLTFFVIGDNLRRQVNIYNSLAASAFFLLLVNPNNLFEVGFQLSYAAVFGIVFLQPRLEKLWTIEQQIPRYFWQLLTVSIAAQIATFPFSIFYFNQFPTYFWISNLFVIPAVGILIPLGFSLLVFHSIPVLGSVLSYITNFIIGVIYSLLKGIDSLPFSVSEIVITPVELALLFGMLLSIFLLVANPSKKIYIKTTLVVFLLLVTTSLVLKTNNRLQKQLIVYNDADNSIVHVISGRTNYIISEQPVTSEDYAMQDIENTVMHLGLQNPRFLTADSNFEDNTILLEDGLLIFENRSVLIHPKFDVSDLRPEIIINPEPGANSMSSTIVVSTKRYLEQNNHENNTVFSLEDEGAFIKKW